MEEVARGEVEILVHTTAPSHARDDARYRALAQRYLDFQPFIRRKLDKASQLVIEEQEVADDQLNGELLQSTQDERESRASYQPEEEEELSKNCTPSTQHQQSSDRQSITDFPPSSQLSFRSVADNVHSPALRFGSSHIHATVGERHLRSSADSWGAAPSTVADSQPECHAKLGLESSPTGVHETYLCLTQVDGSSPELPVHRSRNEAELLEVVFQAEEIEGSEGTGLQSSPSPQKRLQEVHGRNEENIGMLLPAIRESIVPSKRRQDDSTADYGSSPPLMPSSMITALKPTQLQTRSSKRQRIEPTNSSLSSYAKVTKLNMPSNLTSSMTSNTDTFDWTDFLEIRPPLPPTSEAKLTADMFITEPLRVLKDRISSRGQYPYVPLSQIRKLREMEWGYWLVDSEKWDISTRLSCWNYLGRYVSTNLAGWGVSCVRDLETRFIRIYCWGIIAEHIYLLLHIASTSKIKGTGARWIAGDGTAVIVMPS